MLITPGDTWDVPDSKNGPSVKAEKLWENHKVMSVGPHFNPSGNIQQFFPMVYFGSITQKNETTPLPLGVLRFEQDNTHLLPTLRAKLPYPRGRDSVKEGLCWNGLVLQGRRG